MPWMFSSDGARRKDLVLMNSGAQSLSLAPKHCRDQQERQHRRSRLIQQLHLNHIFLASGTERHLQLALISSALLWGGCAVQQCKP